VAVLRAVPGFAYDPGRSFRAWLHTVLANKVRDLRRKKVPVPLADGSGFPAPADDPVPALDEAEYRRVLADRAARLVAADFTPATWKAFWGTAVDGRPAAEVAAEVGLSVNAVYLARARVLARLRRELAGLWE
jgi:RNA polymerase sigma-70 factor (ECF subfamily)